MHSHLPSDFSIAADAANIGHNFLFIVFTIRRALPLINTILAFLKVATVQKAATAALFPESVRVVAIDCAVGDVID
jgi:hypothetical protein